MWSDMQLGDELVFLDQLSGEVCSLVIYSCVKLFIN